MPGSVSCALSDWPLLSCWIYDHAALLGFAAAVLPMAVIAAVWWLEARRNR